MGRPVRRHRHRNPLGPSPAAAPRRQPQARRPPGRAARPPLRPADDHDQPPDPQPRPGRRRAGAHPARPRACHPARAPRRPRLQVAATRRGHAALGDDGTSAWLFPGGQPGRPDQRLPPRPSACARSASTPASHGRPHCSSSPPTCPPPSWRHARHPHQRRRPAGSGPPPATGRPTPPTSAAGPGSSPFRHVAKRGTRHDRPTASCPVCGGLLPPSDRPHGGRKPRYCSGACKAKAYRARQQAGGPARRTRRRSRPPPAMPAAIEIRQQVSELIGIMADTASGQLALFASPHRPAARPSSRDCPDTAPPDHRTRGARRCRAVTERVTKRQTPGGTTPAKPLLDEGSNHR